MQAEEVEEGNCPSNINRVTDNKVDVNRLGMMPSLVPYI